MDREELDAIRLRSQANAGTLAREALVRIWTEKKRRPGYTVAFRCVRCHNVVCVDGDCECCRVNKLTVAGVRVNIFAQGAAHEPIGRVEEILQAAKKKRRY